MDEHACSVLEFDRVCTFLESCAQSAGGRRACRRTQPAADAADVQRLQQETAEMRVEIEDCGPLALSSVHDIGRDVQRASIENFHLDQLQLLRIADTLQTAASVKAFCVGLQEKAPSLFQRAETLTDFKSLTAGIHTSISPRGDILESASPRLGELRAQVRSLRSSILRSLEKYLQDVDLSFAVQDDFITLRNNRFVIPVRSDRKSSIPGVVHDQSQSKATFFVEPLEIVDINNTLQITNRDIHYEEIRILTELTRAVSIHEADILCSLSVLEELDAIHARACLARVMAAEPVSISPDGSIALTGCRHPILAARRVPPPALSTNETPEEKSGVTWAFDRSGVVDIEIVKQSTVRTLVISGANAGGKTVTLKTLGLFVLMHQSGMHLPVAPGGRIALYANVFADIGDEQNIETSQSTFSAHMGRIRDVVNGATDRSLVLLDELGSGTDPSEGAALGVAILDHLRARGCATLVTSHLNRLKTYAAAHDDADNVSVAFDPDTHRPLYRLVYGLPGFSNALSIARGIGIPETILSAAAAQGGEAGSRAGDLIDALEQSRRLLQEKHERLNNLQQQAAALHDAGRRLLNALRTRRDRFLKNFEQSARTLLSTSEERLRTVIRQQRRNLRNHPDESLSAEARQELQQVRNELQRRFPRGEQPVPTVEHLKPGQRITVISLKKNGTVAAVDTAARRAEIDLGGMRVKAGFSDLSPAQPPEGKKPGARPPSASVSAPEAPIRLKQLNVIGLRVADALPLVDKGIDTAVLQGADVLEVIHGRGTGRLMRAIHEHLHDHAQVARLLDDRDNPGTGGVTRVELK